MRLLVVSDYDYPTGGCEEFVREFLAHGTVGTPSRLVTWTAAAPVPAGFDGIDVVEHGDLRGLWEQLDRADVVLLVTSFNVRMLARTVLDHLELRGGRCVTVVQTSANSSPGTSLATAQTGWLGRLLRASSAVVAVSDAVGAALGRLPGARPEAVTVIENGSRLFASRAPRTRREVVSFVGRPTDAKGYPDFLRLVRDLSGSGLRFAANTVSISPDEREDGVEYSTRLSDADLRAFFADADLLVVPYRYADGLPLAVLEALSCGVPVLGYDGPVVGPLLRRHGQRVVPAQYPALRDAVEGWRVGGWTPNVSDGPAPPTWAAQIAAYDQLLSRVAAAPPAGGTDLALSES